jgi:hypothetical protein
MAARRAPVDLAQMKAVGVGMALDSDHFGDVNIGETRLDFFNVLDLKAGHREPPAEFVDLRLDRNEFLEPT